MGRAPPGGLTGADADAVIPWAVRLCPELDRTRDLTGYALRLTGGSPWGVSAWSRRASLAAVERGALHTAALRGPHPLLQRR